MTHTKQRETVVHFNPENQTVQMHDTDCYKSCEKREGVVERVQEVLNNVDFKCNTEHTQSIETCIADSRVRCVMTLNLDDNL